VSREDFSCRDEVEGRAVEWHTEAAKARMRDMLRGSFMSLEVFEGSRILVKLLTITNPSSR
jgi:hypothetical protein